MALRSSAEIMVNDVFRGFILRGIRLFGTLNGLTRTLILFLPNTADHSMMVRYQQPLTTLCQRRQDSSFGCLYGLADVPAADIHLSA